MTNFKVIRDICNERKISLKYLASEIGITEHGLQLVMRNNSTNTQTIEKIAKILNVPVGYFFGESGVGAVVQNGTIVNGTNHGSIKVGDVVHEIQLLREKLAAAQKEIELKDKIIRMLENTKE